MTTYKTLISAFLYYLGLTLILLALLVLIGIPVTIWERRKRKRKIEEAFAGREPLDGHTFYEKYFRARGVPADIVLIVMRLEEEFGIKITDAEAGRTHTVEGIINLVWSKSCPREA